MTLTPSERDYEILASIDINVDSLQKRVGVLEKIVNSLVDKKSCLNFKEGNYCDCSLCTYLDNVPKA